ncbi:unnamed protein product [Enterobius vermicularis]|uniref:C2H2-type domain-containing protein n=1 Tax=Enterobius vermicularis TaxID=51028 RepID=A0A0N4VKX6_ENTVE|nr:unnamed protein product [Enterobius vermicularis]
MADSEAKARKKLEEAEKKSKGSSGFFAGLFGSSKADEAVELYVQDLPCPEVILLCTENGCGETFDDIVSYEDHVLYSHTFQCIICGRRCFCNPYERDMHCLNEHGISDGNSVSVRRKVPQRVSIATSEIHQSLQKKTCSKKAPRELWISVAVANFNFSCLVGYFNAGNLFKVAKLWKDAGDAFVKAAELNAAKGDAKHDTATNYAEAANCYRKVNPQVAVDCLMKTADIYTDMGRFNMAAKNHCAIAELFENECPDVAQCMAHYQKAADYYKGEESKSSATKCLIKVAQYAAQLEQYRKAIQVFEEIAMWEADHQTLKYAAKNHFFQALLCHLCVDLLDAQHALKRYKEISPSFADTRECKLISELIECMEEEKQDSFTDAVKNYDKISHLDQWHTALLVKIKRSIAGEGDDLK